MLRLRRTGVQRHGGEIAGWLPRMPVTIAIMVFTALPLLYGCEPRSEPRSSFAMRMAYAREMHGDSIWSEAGLAVIPSVTQAFLGLGIVHLWAGFAGTEGAA